MLLAFHFNLGAPDLLVMLLIIAVLSAPAIIATAIVLSWRTAKKSRRHCRPPSRGAEVAATFAGCQFGIGNRRGCPTTKMKK